MVVWTDEKVCDRPVAYNLDGRGTAFNPETDIIAVTRTEKMPVIDGLEHVVLDNTTYFWSSELKLTMASFYHSAECCIPSALRIFLEKTAKKPPLSLSWADLSEDDRSVVCRNAGAIAAAQCYERWHIDWAATTDVNNPVIVADHDADRYWIAGGVNNLYSNTGNWSTVSGGVGGASVPIAGDTGHFDTGSANYNCTVDQAVTGATTLEGTYAGTITWSTAATAAQTITQSTGTISIAADVRTATGYGLSLTGGTFTIATTGSVGSRGNITISNTFTNNNYIGTIGTLTLTATVNIGTLYIQLGGVGAANTTTLGANLTCGALTVQANTAGDVTTLNTSISNYSITCTSLTIVNQSAYAGTSATLIPNASTITVSGATIIGVASGAAGTLGGNTAWVASVNSVTTNATGTLNAPNASGSFTITGGTSNFVLKSGGTFAHNGGTVTWTSTANSDINYASGVRSIVFNNVTVNLSTTAIILRQRPATAGVTVTIEGTLTITRGIYDLWCTDTAQTLIMGTTAAAGSIVNNGTLRFSANTTNIATIKAASATYPVACTGTDWDWDYGGSGSKVAIADINYAPNAVTGGAGVTVTCSGTIKTTGTLTVSAADTWGANAAWVGDFDGDLTFNGTLLLGTHSTGHTVAGRWTNNSTSESWSCGTSTVTFDGSVVQTITCGELPPPLNEFYHLTIAKPVVSLQPDVVFQTRTLRCGGNFKISSGWVRLSDISFSSVGFLVMAGGKFETATITAERFIAVGSVSLDEVSDPTPNVGCFGTVEVINNSVYPLRFEGVPASGYLSRGFYVKSGASFTWQGNSSAPLGQTRFKDISVYSETTTGPITVSDVVMQYSSADGNINAIVATAKSTLTRVEIRGGTVTGDVAATKSGVTEKYFDAATQDFTIRFWGNQTFSDATICANNRPRWFGDAIRIDVSWIIAGGTVTINVTTGVQDVIVNEGATLTISASYTLYYSGFFAQADSTVNGTVAQASWIDNYGDINVYGAATLAEVEAQIRRSVTSTDNLIVRGDLTIRTSRSIATMRIQNNAVVDCGLSQGYTFLCPIIYIIIGCDIHNCLPVLQSATSHPVSGKFGI